METFNTAQCLAPSYKLVSDEVALLQHLLLSLQDILKCGSVVKVGARSFQILRTVVVKTRGLILCMNNELVKALSILVCAMKSRHRVCDLDLIWGSHYWTCKNRHSSQSFEFECWILLTRRFKVSRVWLYAQLMDIYSKTAQLLFAVNLKRLHVPPYCILILKLD